MGLQSFLQCICTLPINQVVESHLEISIFFCLGLMFFYHQFPQFKFHNVGLIGCFRLYQISEFQGFHCLSKVMCMCGVHCTNICYDLLCGFNISVRSPLSCPVIYLTVQPGFPTLEPLLSATLFLIYIIPSTLSLSMAHTSLPIVTLAVTCRIFILVTFVPHWGLVRTTNIMLCSMGRPATEPMSMPVTPSLTC